MSLENLLIWLGTGFVLGVGFGMGNAVIQWVEKRLVGESRR